MHISMIFGVGDNPRGGIADAPACNNITTCKECCSMHAVARAISLSLELNSLLYHCISYPLPLGYTKLGHLSKTIFPCPVEEYM